MEAIEILKNHLVHECPQIHTKRLESIISVASGLQKSQNLSLTSMGRKISGEIGVKHKIKKVDRLESNQYLHRELNDLYAGLSSYILQYITHEQNLPIIIDLCFMQDNKDIQMLSAEIVVKGRSIPLYRDLFYSGGLKGRAKRFLENLSKCLPEKRDILIIMDAGFGEDWLKEIEAHGWYWLLRIREGKKIKLNETSDWLSVRELMSQSGSRTKSYNEAFIMSKHNHPCRLITKKNREKNTKEKYNRQPRNYNCGNGSYSRSWKEPWFLATNLPIEYQASKIVNYYQKRMQIEESFRDIKSHQFGLSGRYIRTTCIHRWGVKMLLAAIVQIVFWIIGVVGHSQNFQKIFQANTVKNKKVFSYFYLGKLIIEHNMLKELKINYKKISEIIDEELAKKW